MFSMHYIFLGQFASNVKAGAAMSEVRAVVCTSCSFWGDARLRGVRTKASRSLGNLEGLGIQQNFGNFPTWRTPIQTPKYCNPNDNRDPL